MKRFAVALLALALCAPLTPRVDAAEPGTVSDVAAALKWRSIGPYIGGRVVAIAGVPNEPNIFYFGGVEGGIWKSTDYGNTWNNISDDSLPRKATSIGALAVAPSNANIMYAGTGEADIRGDFDTGDGVYKSTDAGKTWHYAGLRETHMTTQLAIDPRNPNVVYASSMGHVFKDNTERGIFKTTDGGKSWSKVLYVDAKTGGAQVLLDPKNPNTVYASMWQAQRVPWKLTSGGPGSGLYKSTDGGAHWTNISKHPGFATGTLGKLGISVSATDPRRVYAIVQAHDGGVFRSDDGGATWQKTNDEGKLRQRAFYYTAIFADPTNKNVAYAPNVDDVWKTTDGGKTWKHFIPNGIHGDNHIIWINPLHPNIMLEGNDGGAMVTTDSGKTWSTLFNQPTGQFYKVALDGEFPFNVYGAQQDEGAYEGPSAYIGGLIPFGEWHNVALGESTWVAPEPGNPFGTFGSGYYSSLAHLDRSTGEEKNVSPWARYMPGNNSKDTKYRFGWTHPIFFSQGDPNELLVGGNVVFSSHDKGQTWKVISPDLTRNDPSTEGNTGGPIENDQTGAETFPDIASLAASPKNADVLWAGSADGLLHVTTDHGANWQDVTPPSLPQWAQISCVEPSHTDAGTAYVSASRYMWDDFHPFIFKTTDYGKHWTQLTSGIPSDEYVMAVREDPREPRLLVAGTRSTAYFSLDSGAHWQPLTMNLPGVQVRDLAFNARQGMLVAATHGRSFWILDNVSLLEDLARNGAKGAAQPQLFTPETAWLTHAYGDNNPGGLNAGDNPEYGASIFFTIPKGYNGKTPATLTITDAKGITVRSFALHLKNKKKAELTDAQKDRMDQNQLAADALQDLTAVEPGTNKLQWDLRYPSAYEIPGWRVSPTDDWINAGFGPTVLPGEYTATLAYGSTKLSQPLTVKLDPRLHPSEGDLEARLALEQKIVATIDNVSRTVAAGLNARSRMSAANRAKFDNAFAKLVMMQNNSSEANVVHPSQVRDQLGNLLNSVEGAYQKPTPAEYAAYDEMNAEIQAHLTDIKSSMP